MRVKQHVGIIGLAAICLAFFLSKLPVLSHYPSWDEAVYVGMGKFMYSGGASGLWEMVRPLALPTITGLWWQLGLPALEASRIVGLLFSIGGIIVAYFLGRKLFDWRVGLLAAAILAVTPIFFYYGEYVMTDHVGTLLIVLGVLLFISERPVWAGAMFGLAFWFKFTHTLAIIALIALAVIAFIRSRKLTREVRAPLIAVGVTLCFVAVYFGANAVIYHNHLSFVDSVVRPYSDAAAYQNNPYQNTPIGTGMQTVKYFLYYPLNIISNSLYGFVIYALAILAPFLLWWRAGVKRRVSEKLKTMSSHLIVLVFFGIYLLHASLIPYKTDRFWVIFLPVAAIYAAYALIESVSRLRSAWPSARTLIVVIVVLCIGVLFVHTMVRDLALSTYPVGSPDIKIERYFDDHNMRGPILTNDPRFVAYSDARYIPAYDIMNPRGFFINDWESNTDFQGVAYNDKSIPCLPTDARCISNLEKMNSFIRTNYVMTDSYQYNWANVSFWQKPANP